MLRSSPLVAKPSKVAKLYPCRNTLLNPHEPRCQFQVAFLNCQSEGVRPLWHFRKVTPQVQVLKGTKRKRKPGCFIGCSFYCMCRCWDWWRTAFTLGCSEGLLLRGKSVWVTWLSFSIRLLVKGHSPNHNTLEFWNRVVMASPNSIVWRRTRWHVQAVSFGFKYSTTLGTFLELFKWLFDASLVRL